MTEWDEDNNEIYRGKCLECDSRVEKSRSRERMHGELGNLGR
jgi:hypothetical protein